MGAPSIEHERRVQILDDLAVLMGFHTPLPCLPDLSRPDVCRATSRHRHLFFGDAKETETPANYQTQKRLSKYLHFLRGCGASASASVVAVCFGDPRQRNGWETTLVTLAAEQQFLGTVRFHLVDAAAVIACLTLVGDQPAAQGAPRDLQ
jgi:hypothetical protein